MARRLYLAVLGMTVLALPASAYVLTLTPSTGAVSGLPGSTVGWSYSITNSSSIYYMVIANSYFCESGQDPLFTTCTPALGVYSDFIAGNETVIAPSATASQTFNSAINHGVGGYAIQANAHGGQTDSGFIVVIYDLYTANPFTDPSAQQMGGDAELSAAAAVSVQGPVSVPALSDWVLAALALGLMAFAAWRIGGKGGPDISWRAGLDPRGSLW